MGADHPVEDDERGGDLRVAEILGVDPQHCVAIEDTPIGAKAAVAAGMRTMAVLRGHVARATLVATGAEVVEKITSEVIGL
jgi:beta-phosphoglucomutase-like phosphatase (HAD superfamily)